MDSQQIQVFVFSSTEIRTITTSNKEIYFIAQDVCKALDLDNVARATSRLDEHERLLLEVTTFGGNQKMTAINESGLYSLVLSSRKPEAKVFKKWVTSEVLPSIRKTGKYEVAPKASEEDFDEDGNALTAEGAGQKIDYELICAQNLLKLIDDCIDDKLTRFKRKDLQDAVGRLLFEQKQMKTEIMQYIAMLANRLNVALPLPAQDNAKPFVSYVYLMEKTDDFALLLNKHKCKVGKSNNTQKRKFQLESGGSPLEIIDEICFDSEAEAIVWERAIKMRFASCLIDREWFFLEESHLDFFRSLAVLIQTLLR
jgi:prophage antirepressor-like protein